MPYQYSTSPGGAYDAYSNPPSNVSLDNLRRTFDLSGMIQELRPVETPFFTYLTKVRKVPTTDPVFKMMEQRHQWQRRNFTVAGAVADDGSDSAPTNANLTTTGFRVSCDYDARGKKTTTSNNKPSFFVAGQIVAIENVTCANPAVTGTLYAKVLTTADVVGTGNNENVNSITLKVEELFILSSSAKTDVSAGTSFTIPVGSRAQIVGTAYGEATGAPDGWADVLGQTEGYAQIFKTACPLMSGTAMATEYRGKKNEFQRIWDEKMREHKMDIEHSALFGVGHVAATSGALTAEAGGVNRYTWGVLPFVSLYGNTGAFSYAASGYNDFVDFTETFFAPENGNSMSKLVLASRKIIGWFSKLNQGSFLGNTLVAEAARLDVQNLKFQFGFNLTRINTVFGELNFVAHPLLRNQWEDHVIVLDLPNISYRPLVGNGISRDTYYQTNVQDNDVDGRIDQMITEAGIQITLPETHAVLKWS